MDNEPTSDVNLTPQQYGMPWLTLFLLMSLALPYFLLSKPEDWSQSLQDALVLRWGAMQGLLVAEGEGLRLITQLFIHQRFDHLLINLAGVLIFMIPVELRLGSLRTFIIFMAGGLTGSALACIQQPLDEIYCGATSAVWSVAIIFVLLHVQLLGGLGAFFRHAASIVSLAYFALYLALIRNDPDPSLHYYHGGLIAAFSVGMFFLAGNWLRELADPERQAEIRRFRNTLLVACSMLLTIGVWLTLLPNPLMNYRRARYYLDHGRSVSLIPLLEKRANDPIANIQTCHLLASEYVGRGKIDTALKIYDDIENALNAIDLEALQEDQKTSSTSSGGLGLMSWEKSRLNPNTVIEYLRQTALERSRTLSLAGKDNAATQTLAQSLEYGASENPATAGETMQMLSLYNLPDQAEKYIRGIIEKQPGERWPYMRLIELYTQYPTADRDQALSIAMEIEREFGREQWPLYCEGRIHEAFCDYDRALDVYRKVEDASSTSTASLSGDEWEESWRHQGVCHLRMARYEKARPLLELAYNRAYGGESPIEGALFFEHTLDYVLCLLRLDEKDHAKNTAENYLQDYLCPAASEEGSWLNMNHLAWFLAETGLHPEEALSAAENSVQLLPNSINLDTLAWALYRNGKYERALKIQRQALEKALFISPELHFHHGAILEALDQPYPAFVAYENALRIGLDFSDYRDCQESLVRLGKQLTQTE